jgi:hypothetical protein
VAVSLAGVFVYTIFLTVGAITNNYAWGPVMTYVGFPLALWITAGFMAVVAS